MNLDEIKLKELLKTAIVELLQEQKEVLDDLFAEIMEDIAQYGSVKAKKLISDVKFRSFYSLSSTSVLRLFRAKL